MSRNMPEADPGRHAAFARDPFMRMLQVERVFSRDGQARLVAAARHELTNPVQAMHGGVIATLVDVAMASAAVSRIGFRRTIVTLNLNTSYLRPGRGHLVTDGEVVGFDADDIVHCKAVVTDEAGSVVARAAGSFRYLDHRPAPPSDPLHRSS